MNFENFNLHPKINAGIQACKFVNPTPIQLEAIPLAMKGHDILGLAQTGTGKTAAFALPLLHHLMNGPRRKVRALIIAPTRELAEQIHNATMELGARTGLRSVAVYGGVSKFAQVKKIRAGVDIIVACPGRLLDLLSERSVNLSTVRHLILDEADHMFDMGFLPDIKRIIKILPKERQTMLFSATMAHEIRQLAESTLRDPKRIQINFTKPTERVSHVVYSVEHNKKPALLKKLLRSSDVKATLVFTRTKHLAKKLGEKLAKEGYKATSIQGNLSQAKRREALDGFKKGRFQILVATDVAARGIDVNGISHVINYDMPDTLDAYTHRIGRTGRASATGQALNLACRKDQGLIFQIEKLIGKKMTRIGSQENMGPARKPGKEAMTGVPSKKAKPYNKKKKKPSWHKKRTRQAAPLFGGSAF